MTALPRPPGPARPDASVPTPGPRALTGAWDPDVGAAWRALAWAGIAALAGVLAAAALEGRWPAAASALAFLLPAVAFRLVPHRLPVMIEAFAFTASAVSVAGWAWDWYAAWPPFDEALHLLNPVVILAASAWWLRQPGLMPAPERRGAFVLAAAALGTGMGLAWEAIESTFLDLELGDTLSDLALNLAGSAAGGALAAALLSRPGRAPGSSRGATTRRR